MAITDEQIAKFKAFYDSKATAHVCPICGRNDWQPENIILLRGLDDPETGYPVIPLRCQNCHYTRLFNAKLVGLLD